MPESTPAERIARHFSYGPASIRDHEGRYWTNAGDIRLSAAAGSPSQVFTLKAGTAPGTVVSFWSTTGSGVLDADGQRLSAATADDSERGKAAVSFGVVPGLGGPGLSFCRSDRWTEGKTKYLVASDDGAVRLLADDGGPTFRQRATFHVDRALTRDPLRHLTMVNVTIPWRTENDRPYWELSCVPKMTPALRVYDVAIFKAGAETGRSVSTVEVYRFEFDDTIRESLGTFSWPDYRAKYLVGSFPFELGTHTYLDPSGAPYVRTEFESRLTLPALKSALSAVIADARGRGELAQFGITYKGHGDTAGMFEDALDPADDAEFLSHVTAELGAHIDVLDFGSNCNVATVQNFGNFAPYADYIVASDLSIGRSGHGRDYGKYALAGRTMRETIEAELRGVRAHYEEIAGEIEEERRSEAIYLFDARRYVELLAQIDLDAANDKAMLTANPECAHAYNGGPARAGDVMAYVQKSGNLGAWTAFNALRLSAADTKGIHWGDEYANANGLILDNWTFAR